MFSDPELKNGDTCTSSIGYSWILQKLELVVTIATKKEEKEGIRVVIKKGLKS